MRQTDLTPRPASSTALPALAAAGLLLAVLFALGPARGVVAVAAGLVLACLAASVAVAVGQERSGRRTIQRAEAFARSRRPAAPAPRKETRR